MHTSTWTIRLGLLALAAAGCAKSAAGGGTPGEQGRIEFSFQQGCLFGCPLEQPLLAGTRQEISVSDPGDAAGIKLSSSKPKVAEFALERACYCERDDHRDGRVDIAEDANCDAVWHKHCDNTILVQGNAAGETFLELRSKDGPLIDRVAVLVREAARARIEATFANRLGAMETSSIDLHTGNKVDLAATLYDDAGRKLLAGDHVSWAVDDDQVAVLSAWLAGGGRQISAGTGISVQAKGVGKTVLTVTVPGLEKAIDIKVTAP